MVMNLPYKRMAVKREMPTREEQVVTLEKKLRDPSTPESVKASLEAAITRIVYRPRRTEVLR